MDIWENVYEHMRGSVTNQKGSINLSMNCFMEIGPHFYKKIPFWNIKINYKSFKDLHMKNN